METFQAIVIGAIALSVMILMAGVLSEAHAPKQRECVQSGHKWNPTKYVCEANLKK
jgi:hypothetical protein